MNFDISLFLIALGLAAVLEALPWLLSPERMRDAMMKLAELSPEQLRIGGFVLLAAGLLLCAAGKALR